MHWCADPFCVNRTEMRDYCGGIWRYYSFGSILAEAAVKKELMDVVADGE
jgi:hypothetical protein